MQDLIFCPYLTYNKGQGAATAPISTTTETATVTAKVAFTILAGTNNKNSKRENKNNSQSSCSCCNVWLNFWTFWKVLFCQWLSCMHWCQDDKYLNSKSNIVNSIFKIRNEFRESLKFIIKLYYNIFKWIVQW